MIEKINIKLIFVESITLIFLISGIQRLYVATQAKKYISFINNDLDKFDSLNGVRLGELLVNRGYWSFGIFIIGILTIGFINWKYKTSILNSILIFVIVFSLFPFRFFSNGIIHRNLNYFGGMFTNNYGIAFLISGTFLTLIGLILLWKSLNMNKSTIHNNS